MSNFADFSTLLDSLYYTSSTKAKTRLLCEYLARTPDPDRGWAIAALSGTLQLEFFTRSTVKNLMLAHCDPVLFSLSYDYVGEMSETVAHMWPGRDTIEANIDQPMPTLNDIIIEFSTTPKKAIPTCLAGYLDRFTPSQRWALVKLGTRGLRVGVSARLVKNILAEFASNPTIQVSDIETLWHGVAPPYTELLTWLEGKSPKPDVTDRIVFHSVMLAHPVTDDELDLMDFSQWQGEYKYDGIRVQMVASSQGIGMFSRTGDDIAHSFPDVIELWQNTGIHGVFDGELLAFTEDDIATFNQLQQRLNKKKPTKKLMNNIPCGLIIYDCIALGSDAQRRSLVELPLSERHKLFTEVMTPVTQHRLRLSPPLVIDSKDHCIRLRDEVCEQSGQRIEGLMLKRKASLYVPGRPKGQWVKFKRDPMLIDAVIMYAQRGHGKRSSFYSDYTFGCWATNDAGERVILPIGKAYSGFTDAELHEIDKWVRKNTIGRFGPVKEVAKELVFEVAFDAVHYSKRHKSGVALRFPRIHRIRWDKPANEADELETLVGMIAQ